MNKTALMRRLKIRHDELSKEARSFKTKAAQIKRWEKVRKTARTAHFVLLNMLTSGDKLVLSGELLCTGTFGGGAYGISKGSVIKVETVSIDYFTFSAGEQVFSASLFSGGWSKTSLEVILNSEKAA